MDSKARNLNLTRTKRIHFCLFQSIFVRWVPKPNQNRIGERWSGTASSAFVIARRSREDRRPTASGDRSRNGFRATGPGAKVGYYLLTWRWRRALAGRSHRCRSRRSPRPRGDAPRHGTRRRRCPPDSRRSCTWDDRPRAPHANATRRTPVGIAAGDDDARIIIHGLGVLTHGFASRNTNDRHGDTLVVHPVEAGRAAPYVALRFRVRDRRLWRTERHLADACRGAARRRFGPPPPSSGDRANCVELAATNVGNSAGTTRKREINENEGK